MSTDNKAALSTNISATEEPPSSRRVIALNIAAALVALIGMADAVYLTVEHITGASVRCTVIAGCSEVLSSPYATVHGIPLAFIGAVAYFSVFSLATLGAFNYKGVDKLMAVIVGLMFLTTLWLLYLQAFVIHAFCQFCLLSAAVNLTLGVIVALQLKRTS
jgi:uncharacterized membrane protein